MNMLLNDPAAARRVLPRPVQMMTAGAAPPAAVIEGMEAKGFKITHVYGLTETYGPSTVCAWHDEWDERDSQGQRATQGAPGRHLPGKLRRVDGRQSPIRSPLCRRIGATMGEVAHAARQYRR